MFVKFFKVYSTFFSGILWQELLPGLHCVLILKNVLYTLKNFTNISSEKLTFSQKKIQNEKYILRIFQKFTWNVCEKPTFSQEKIQNEFYILRIFQKFTLIVCEIF